MMDAVFVALVAAAAIYEVWALWIRRAPGDTVSEHVWELRDRGIGWRIGFDAALAWLVWHFVFDPERGPDRLDFAALLTGAVVAAVTWKRDHRTTPDDPDPLTPEDIGA